MDDIYIPLSGLFSFIAGDGFCYRELCKEALEAFKHSLSVIWSSPSLKRSEKKEYDDYSRGNAAAGKKDAMFADYYVLARRNFTVYVDVF